MWLALQGAGTPLSGDNLAFAKALLGFHERAAEKKRSASRHRLTGVLLRAGVLQRAGVSWPVTGQACSPLYVCAAASQT